MRVRQPFYRKQTRSFYVELNGRQIPLGTDEKLAWEKYHELMLDRQAATPTSTVGSPIEIYLRWCKANREPRTAEFYSYYLQSFKAFVGAPHLSDLKPYARFSFTPNPKNLHSRAGMGLGLARLRASFYDAGF
jgi:hypothetical protein